MSRRAGLVILLVSIPLALLLAWVMRTPPGSARPPGGAHGLLPLQGRPAKIFRGRFRGGAPPAPKWFDATTLAVPRELILDTNLRPEDFPPLNMPPVISAGAHDEDSGELVIGIVVDGVPRAYPLSALDLHWAINDVVDGRRVVILCDPISGAVTAYQGSIDGRPLEVGASGKWYRGNALFYDRASTSLFPIISGRFISGPLAGRGLRPIPFRREMLSSWLRRYPDTKIATNQQPRATDPLALSEVSLKAIAAILPREKDGRLGAVEWVVGFVDPIGGPACCALKDLGAQPLRLGRAVIEQQPGGGARAMLSGGVWPQQTVCRYFAWAGAFPDTEVWTPASPSLRSERKHSTDGAVP